MIMLGEQNNIFMEQHNMLWEQNIFMVGTKYKLLEQDIILTIEGTKYFFFSHGLNQSPYKMVIALENIQRCALHLILVQFIREEVYIYM